jgi:hypothetical protein
VRKTDNLPPSCADVKKSGSLNLLEPCRPVQACNGTALPLALRLVQNILSSNLVCRDIKIKIYRTIILPVVSYGCETWSCI